MDLLTPAPFSLFTTFLLLCGWLLCLNAAAWALAGIDRRRWAFGGQRLSQSALLWLALLGGWPGLLYGLRDSKRLKVRYHNAFRGWLRAAMMTQALVAALALAPHGALVVATEKLAALIMPEAVASERSERPEPPVPDSQRG